ncbi:TetR/AcrR family transcriptional regulator [Rhizobium skierniewicense]|uniref:TetR/AcrR family transcriptional regulator n=1 Tax=Rhizobium skierniewicense TaxID=984260 RepID=UPI001FAE2AAC|nr:TetR/AcrR family transcriptional regulator [Rhizobium skierniewicense]
MKPEKSDCGSEQKIAPRDRIVSMACQLFREHGIRGIGVDAIAEAASTNKMTLYRHFGSKDDLVCEVLKHSSRTLEKVWGDLETENPGDPRAQLAAWVKARAQCLSSEPYGCDLANAAVELKEQGHPAHAIIETLKMEQHSRLTDLCRSTGVSDPELLADTLSMLLEGARVSKLAAGKDGPSMRFTRACEVTMVSFGLCEQASS